MFETILYPTDFSDVALKASEYIKNLTASGAKEVIVLHVNDTRGNDSVLRILGENQFNKLEKSKREVIDRKLNGVQKEFADAGLAVTVRVENGMPVREILRVEEEENVSVIVIGSHGRSNLEEMFLGSVSEKVIRKSRAPVLVVKR